ncbi:hypothetical protein ABIA27_002541 [Sinorhizobium fredii]
MTFLALISILIAAVMSILAFNPTDEPPPPRPAIVPTNY